VIIYYYSDIHTAAVQWFFSVAQRYMLQQFCDSSLLFREILYHCSEIHAVAVQWFYPLFRDKYCSCSVILYHCSETHTRAVQWFNTIVQIYIPQQFSDSSLLFRDTNYSSSVIFAIVQRTYCSSSVILHHSSENILQQFSDSLLLFREHNAVVQWFFTIVKK